MTGDPAGGGFLLTLLTDSFAVRALLGSLAAVGLAALAVRAGVLRSTRARRLLVLAPVLAAAAAGVATARQATAHYLPELWLTGSSSDASGRLLDFTEWQRWVGLARELDLLLVAYVTVVTVLLARRALGVVAVRRVIARGTPPAAAHRRLVAAADRLAPAIGMEPPRLLLVPDCPGGAFAHGLVRPLVAVDPELLGTLDDRELEGLVAHELAHLRRRDGLTRLAVGVFRDLTFFLPTVAIAARWLHHEQEESADEVAARLTARPFALASGILKVWERATPAAAQAACAAVSTGRPALVGGATVLGRRRGGRGTSRAGRVVARRVERLIAGRGGPSRRRVVAESAFAVGVLAVATSVAVVVPGWMVQRFDQVGVVWLPAPAAQPLSSESEAFATFRDLTADAAPALGAHAAGGAVTGGATLPTAGAPTATPDRVGTSRCPCVETQAELRAGVAAATPNAGPSLLWVRDGGAPHEFRDLTADDVPTARTLWTLNERGSRVGLFLVNSREASR